MRQFPYFKIERKRIAIKTIVTIKNINFNKLHK